MKKKLLGIVLCTLGCVGAAFADCSAFSEPEENNPEVDRDGNYIVAFEVTGKPCSDGCHGQIEYRLHYIYHGNKTFSAYSASWRSKRGEPVRVSDDGRINLCKLISADDEDVCEVRHVEITKTSCYD